MALPNAGPISRMTVEFVVLRNRTDELERELLKALPEAAREAAREVLVAAQARVEGQNIGGPPLNPATIAKKASVLKKMGLPLINASRKWAWLDKMVKEETVEERRTGLYSGSANIIAAEGTKLETYHLLERGGANDDGKAVPARFLWTRVLQDDIGQVLNRFHQVLRLRTGLR